MRSISGEAHRQPFLILVSSIAFVVIPIFAAAHGLVILLIFPIYLSYMFESIPC